MLIIAVICLIGLIVIAWYALGFIAAIFSIGYDSKKSLKNEAKHRFGVNKPTRKMIKKIKQERKERRKHETQQRKTKW